MSANQYLIDIFTRHQIFLERFAGGEVKRLDEMMLRLSDDISKSIMAETEQNIRDVRLTRLLTAVRQTIDESVTDLSEATIKQLEEFALYEADFTHRALQMAVNVTMDLPPDNLIISAVRDTSMNLVSGKKVQQLTLEKMFKTFNDKKQTEVSNIIRTGAVQGSTGMEIAREVRRVVTTRAKAQTEAIVRTAVNHIATESKGITFKANNGVLKGVEWVSILDARTSMVCMGRDGKVYPVDAGPRPPAHYRCRSTITAAVLPKYQRKELEGMRKEGKTGEVNAETTYNSWLKRQSKQMQNEILGKERAKLFRSGGLSVSKFTDPRGVMYTLKDLRRLEPLAFDRAGLI